MCRRWWRRPGRQKAPVFRPVPGSELPPAPTSVTVPADTPKNVLTSAARAGYSGRRGPKSNAGSGCGGRRSQCRCALVCRAGARGNPYGTAQAAELRKSAGAGALWRDQPRDRGTDRGRPRTGERIPAHARAVHGREFPVSGEIRLFHHRPGRGGPPGYDRPQRVCAASAPDLFRYSGRLRRACTGRDHAFAGGDGRQHGDRAQRDLGRGAGAFRAGRRDRGRRGRRAGGVSLRPPRWHRGDAGRHRSARARRLPRRSASVLRRRTRRPAIATSSFTRAPVPKA